MPSDRIDHKVVRRMRLREVFERYYLPDLANGSPTTREGYRTVLASWEKLTNNPPVSEITAETLTNFRDECLATLKASTFNSRLRHIRALLRRLAPQMYRNPQGMGVLERIPHIRTLPEERDFPRIATFDELNRLYKACEMASWPRCEVPAVDWWQCWLVLAYNSAARKSDLISLKTEGISLKEKTLRFCAEKTRKWHRIPLNEVVLRHAERVWSDREMVFPCGRSVNPLYRQWHKLQDAAEITPRFGFHCIRKTAASRYNQTIPGIAGYILGSSLRGTINTYYINPTESIAKAVEQLPQPETFLQILESDTKTVIRDPADQQRADWTFTPHTATYRDKTFRLGPRVLSCLRAFVAAGGPLGFDELQKIVWWDAPETVSRITIKTTVHQLRAALMEQLDLPTIWNALPPTGDTWRLYLP